MPWFTIGFAQMDCNIFDFMVVTAVNEKPDESQDESGLGTLRDGE